METEEKQVTKTLYKLELYLLKIMPTLLAICYFLNTTLSYFGIDVPLLSLIGGVSILPLCFLYLSSYTFKFCTYHRLGLHYILISDTIAYYDICVGVPIDYRSLFSINCILFETFVLTALYLKFRLCKSL